MTGSSSKFVLQFHPPNHAIHMSGGGTDVLVGSAKPCADVLNVGDGGRKRDDSERGRVGAFLPSLAKFESDQI